MHFYKLSSCPKVKLRCAGSRNEVAHPLYGQYVVVSVEFRLQDFSEKAVLGEQVLPISFLALHLCLLFAMPVAFERSSEK